jgi:serine/threonine protein kinase
VNVLVNNNGDAVLADFGLSKVKQEFSETSNVVLSGSPRWMAPERLSEGKLTRPVDIYAWAMTAFEVIHALIVSPRLLIMV